MTQALLKVLHIITGLNHGGAEGVLYRLIRATSEEIDHSVISFLDNGPYERRLTETGTPVCALNMRRGRLTVGDFRRLRSEITRVDPDLIQTWMYHADLIGGVAARFAGSPPVVWGIRHSTLDRRHSKWTTRMVARLCALLSRRIPVAVASCSAEAMKVHVALGYRPLETRIIPNGFDLMRFRPDPDARARLRNEMGSAPSEVLLGSIARWDPQKDHETLFTSMALLRRQGLPVRCVLAGTDITPDNQLLTQLIRRYGLEDETFLLGLRLDVPDLMNGIDVHVTSSAYGEAFPNVVAEAMACGTPCVATAVGDAPLIIGDSGWIVPSRQPERLAAAIGEAIRSIQGPSQPELAARCRRRIEQNFSLDAMSFGFLDLWRTVSAVRARS